MSKRWRVWLDHNLDARWIECLGDMPTPQGVEDMLAQLREVLDKRPIVLSPEFEIRVQP